MDIEFNTEFLDKTIQNQPYSENPSQGLLSAWCDTNDSISPHFVDREEWEKMGDEILKRDDEEGKKILYIPKDLTLIEAIDIVVAIDKDTHQKRSELTTKGVEKIEELAQTFRKAGEYIKENIDKIDRGKNLAEEISKKFSDYGYSLESRVKEVNKDIEVIPPVELTEEDRNNLDRWLVGGKIYTNRMARITGKTEPAPKEIEIHKEEIDRERERFFKGYFKALATEGYEGDGEKPWQRSLGPISNIQEKTGTGITNAIKEPEHQILESIFDRGLEGLLMGLNVPQEKTRLYDYLDIPGLKKDLEEVRRNNPNNLDKIAEVEREIAEDIHFVVVRNYRYEENQFKPSEILKGDFLNCLGSTLLGTILLDEVGIKYLYVFPPGHSTTYLVTSNGKLYVQDFTPSDETFTYRPETFEITNDMFEDNVDILSLARRTNSFYVKLKSGGESMYITQNKKGIVATVMRNLGDLYQDIGQQNYAIEAYKKAIQLDPNNAKTYNNLGILYYTLGQQNYAIEAYKKAVEVNPNDADIYYNLGISYQNLEQYNDAIETYKKAIELNPNDTDLYNNLGVLYHKLGQQNYAIRAYKKAIELDPNNAKTYNNLGISYLKLKQYNNAIEAYKKAIEANPNDADLYNNLGISYQKLEQYNDAIEAYKKAFELNFNDPDIYNNLGVLYHKLGQQNYAIQALTKALSIQISEIEKRQLPIDRYRKIRRTCKNLLLIEPKNKDAQKYLEIAEKEINSPTPT